VDGALKPWARKDAETTGAGTPPSGNQAAPRKASAPIALPPHPSPPNASPPTVAMGRPTAAPALIAEPYKPPPTSARSVTDRSRTFVERLCRSPLALACLAGGGALLVLTVILVILWPSDDEEVPPEQRFAPQVKVKGPKDDRARPAPQKSDPPKDATKITPL